jgi:hypothetical protein
MLSKNEKIWRFLRHFEKEKDLSQRSFTPIRQLQRCGTFEEPSGEAVAPDSRRKEQSFEEKLGFMEYSTEQERFQLMNELKKKDSVIEAQEKEIKKLIKEKETLLETLHLKSEEFISALFNQQQQFLVEKEELRRNLDSLTRSIAELSTNFMQSKSSNIHDRNLLLLKTQQQEQNGFHNYKENGNQNDLSEYTAQDNLAMIDITEHIIEQKRKMNQYSEIQNERLRQLKEEQVYEISQLSNDCEHKIDKVQKQVINEINNIKHNHNLNIDSLKNKMHQYSNEQREYTDKLLLNKERKDQELFEEMKEKINSLESTTNNSFKKTETTLKVHSNEIAHLQNCVIETRCVLDKNDQKIEEQFIETQKKNQEEFNNINKHLANQYDKLDAANEKLTELEESDRKDKHKIIEELNTNKEQQKELEEKLQRNTNEIRVGIEKLKIEKDERLHTIFETIENATHSQTVKMHEIVIERLVDETKKQLEYLEQSLTIHKEGLFRSHVDNNEDAHQQQRAH